MGSARALGGRIVAGVLAAGMLSCAVSASDLEEWKGTQRGPGKIVAVLVGPKYAVDLRAKAAMCLVEMRRTDVQPLVLLQRAMERIVNDPARPQIVGATVAPLIALMHGDSPLSRGTTQQALNVQVRAKDAAYVLLAAATAEDRRRLEDGMLAWVMADLNTRWLAGEHNTAEVVRAVGPRAVPVILRVLTPEQLLLKNLTELVRDVGDEAGKATVSARLAQIGQGQLPRVQGRTLEAMAVLGGHSVVEFLLAMAENHDVDEAHRAAALEALAGKVGPGDVERLLAIARDEHAPGDARGEALGLVGDRHDAAVLPQLWPLLATHDKRTRLQVGQIVLNLGGPPIVAEFFRRLPTGAAQYSEDEVRQWAGIVAHMNPPPMSEVRTSLVADSWIARLLSIRVVRERGGREDLSLLRELQADTTRIAGWDGTPAPTVGREAAEAVRDLQGRTSQGGGR